MFTAEEFMAYLFGAVIVGWCIGFAYQSLMNIIAFMSNRG